MTDIRLGDKVVVGRAGIGLDKVKAYSRHAAIGTRLIYADEHDRVGTQRTLADLVAGTLTGRP